VKFDSDNEHGCDAGLQVNEGDVVEDVWLGRRPLL
jgi:hypothetical protein